MLRVFLLPTFCVLAWGACYAGDASSVPVDTLPPALSLERIPLGLSSERPVPKDNPLTEAKVQLGRRLFFDPILSDDGTVACASCHQPEHGFAGIGRYATGIGGKQTTRNAPSLWNRAYGKAFFWDGREPTLEAQALRPIENPLEMGDSVADAVRRLRNHADFSARFRTAFGEDVSAANLAKALASFERVLLRGDSRVDRFKAGALTALDARERHGLWLFESRGRCWRCHSGPNYTDEQLHNTGVSWGCEPLDSGRYGITKQERDRGRFKTPTLRALLNTAPYMHDGSMTNLEEVVEFYNRGGGKNPCLDPALEPLSLTKEEVRNLVAFLQALSDVSTDPASPSHLRR
jgi:cytochrome c peroxidase